MNIGNNKEACVIHSNTVYYSDYYNVVGNRVSVWRAY